MTMRIGVIVPVYNRPVEVLDALGSVAHQTMKPEAVVVVDDGSTDRTVAEVERWAGEAKAGFAFRLIRQANAGAAAARNRGIAELGEVDLVAPLDSDDLWPRDYLERMGAVMGGDAEAVAASADRMNVDGRTGLREWIRLSGVSHRTTRRFFLKGPPGIPNTVFRKSALDAVGGFDAAMRYGGEDYYLMLRVSILGRWLYCPGEAVTVRRNTGQGGGGTGQLSRQFSDRRFHLAKALDRFIYTNKGQEAVGRLAWRRRLGKLWYSAGRQLAGLSRGEEAKECFARAAAVYPLHVRAHLQKWRSGS